MPNITIEILLHQLIFQGMFFVKNIILSKKIGKQIRGKNVEATISIIFFTIFIGTSVILSLVRDSFGQIDLIDNSIANIAGLILLLCNLIISGLSLINLSDSWRVGIVENQKTELISSGIYRFTRNPYFVSYLLMFAGYTIILQNFILLVFSIFGFLFIHKMILKEEKYLYSAHGENYLSYKRNVPRYIIF